MSTSRCVSRVLHDKRACVCVCAYILYIHKEGVSMKLCLEEMIKNVIRQDVV